MKKINWEYCECGCKSHEARYGNLWFSSFMELDKNHKFVKFHLHGNGMQFIGHFYTAEERDAVVLNEIKAELQKSKKEIKKMENLFE